MKQSNDSGSGLDEVRPRQLLRNALWLSGSEAARRVVGFLVAIYLARRLGVQGFGAIGIAFAFVSYLLVAVDLGLDPEAVRRVARRKDAFPSLHRLVVKVRLAASLAAYALLAVLVWILPGQAVGGPLLALVYGGRLFSASLRLNWALRGVDEMGHVGLGILLQNLVYAAGVLVLLRGPQPPLVLVPAAYMLGEGALVAYYLAQAKRRFARLFGGAPSSLGVRGLLRSSWPVAVSKLFRLSFHDGGLILLGWLSTLEQAGFYLAAHRVVTAAAGGASLLQHNFYPTLGRLSMRSLREALALQRAVNRGILGLLLPLLVTAIALAEPLVRWLFGDQFASAAGILAISLPAALFAALALGFQNCLLADGRSRASMTAVGLGAAAHLSLAFLLIPAGGGRGAAWALLAGEIVTLLAAGWLSARVAGHPPAGGRAMLTLACAALMVLAIWAGGALPTAARLLLGWAAFLASALLLGAVTVEELTRLLRGGAGS